MQLFLELHEAAYKISVPNIAERMYSSINSVLFYRKFVSLKSTLVLMAASNVDYIRYITKTILEVCGLEFLKICIFVGVD